MEKKNMNENDEKKKIRKNQQCWLHAKECFNQLLTRN